MGPLGLGIVNRHTPLLVAGQAVSTTLQGTVMCMLHVTDHVCQQLEAKAA
jgi:hypothetical protein